MDWSNNNIYFLTCDIESLYTNIPIEEAITSILHLFQPKYDHFGLTNNDISTLLQLALKDNYFEFFEQCYAQGDCLAMG